MANHGFSGHRERGLDEVKEHNLVIRSQSKSRRTSTRRFQRIVGTRHISPPISACGAHHLRRLPRTHGLFKSKSTRSNSVIRSGYGMDFVTQAFSRRGLPNELVKSPRNVEPTGTGAPSSDLLATQRGRNLDPARLIKEPG